jgi:hypothetical protein
MYPSLKDLIDASSVTELTDLTEAQQDALRAESILAIEGYCAQSFDAEGTDKAPVERILDGNGARKIYLPKRLVSLSVLSVVGVALAASDVLLSEDHNRLHISDEADASSWLTRAMADVTGEREALFTAGPGTVAVSGVWGWADAEFPDAIGTALRYDMEDRALAGGHALSETVRSARALGLDGVQQGGLSVDLAPGEPEVSTRVARLLVDYIWQSAAGAVA